MKSARAPAQLRALLRPQAVHPGPSRAKRRAAARICSSSLGCWASCMTQAGWRCLSGQNIGYNRNSGPLGPGAVAW